MCKSCDIVAITESWLTDSISNAELFSEQYEVFRCDRDFKLTGKSRGGGVLLAVNKNLAAVRVDISIDCTECELLCVKLLFNNFNLYIILLYIAPNTSAATYMFIFDSITNLQFLFGSKVLILGDLNITELHNYYFNNIVHNTTVKYYSNFHNIFDLEQFNYITNSNGHILDVVLSNVSVTVVKSDFPFVLEDLHHPALEFSVSLHTKAIKPCNPNKDYFYNFSKANFLSLYELIRDSDWSNLDNFEDPDLWTEHFYHLINTALDASVPKTLRRKRKYPVWYSKDIISLIKVKDRNRKKYQKTGLKLFADAFKQNRSTLKSLIDNAYKTYLEKVQESVVTDAQNFWRYVHSKGNNFEIPKTVKNKEGTLLDNGNDIVEAFASYFRSVYVNSNTNVWGVGSSKSCSSTFVSITTITEEEVSVAIKKLKSKASIGPDLIPAYVIKGCAEFLIPPLTKLFNLCLKRNIYPDKWKVSRVYPIHKSGSKSSVENYRPISISCTFSKVFESILYSNIYAQVKNIIIDEQHGFMRCRSTSTNLCLFSEYVSNAFANKIQADVIYTDFSKAFDTVDHVILLRKLSVLGFSNALVELIHSYLYNRQQYVHISGYESSKYAVTSGVPQGSVLGPLLFILFINDIITCLQYSKGLLFADDFKIFLGITSRADCLKLQVDINSIYEWSCRNRLYFNIQKCKVISYSTRKEFIMHDYKMNLNNIPRVTEMKDLGVYFDQSMSFNLHITNTVSSCLRNLGFIFRNTKGFSNLNALNVLYSSLVRSKIEYCAMVWNPRYLYQNLCIERVQKKFLRFCYLKLHRSSVYPSYLDLLTQFNYQSLEKRRISLQVQFLFKIINNLIDSPSLLLFINFKVPDIRTRKSVTFSISHFNNGYSLRAPTASMCQTFNTISAEVNIDLFHLNFEALKSLLS